MPSSCSSPSGLKGAVSLGPGGGQGASDLAGLAARPHPEPASSLPYQRTDPWGYLLPTGAPTFGPGHFVRPNLLGPGNWVRAGGGVGSMLHTQGTQDAQGSRLQGFMEDGHSPQLALQGGGAAPPSVLRAGKGGADAALLQGGHQPGPPAKPCGGRD